ncbi:MAG TPA: AbrB/MazE/SpoVT family DNA-binding domain-containing protein [Candidatus Norongarragalinales archaeon]|nr:AbrB/MazE/SpoVT family DNA-binding domain-containing protein [Candidatus Norongarragalinales archaeon]
MIHVKGKLKKWGNSYAVPVPSEIVKREGLKINQDLDVFLSPKTDVPSRIFGMLKGKQKRPTQEIMDELRKELYDD